MSVTTSETKLRGHAEWGDCPESMQKQNGVSGKLLRYATVVGPRTQPAGWDWRPTGKMPIGAAASMSRAPHSLAAQAAWNSRAS